MTKVLTSLGLMSGTSMDGIDVAVLETDGVNHVQQGPSATYPYAAQFRRQLAGGLEEAKAISQRDERPGSLARIEHVLTERHAEAVRTFLASPVMAGRSIDVIGFHGHTVLHRPAERLTVQLGAGRALAELTGIDVVYDLRAADVAAGGQGAPLVAVYHRALAAAIAERPVAFLNIGGVANVTWIGTDGALVAFDTGPGNALIDDWALSRTGSARDEDGRLAAGGGVDEAVLRRLLEHPYFSMKLPKSLDRNAFSLGGVAGLSPADGAATLTAFTAEAVRRSLDLVPALPKRLILCGGGRHNRSLVKELRGRLSVAVQPAEVDGFDGDAMEAQAWAYLAVRSLRGLPITFPMTTGVHEPLPGGVLATAAAP